MIPSEVYVKLTALFPEFTGYWDSPDNYFRDDDGSFTLCGVFAQLSHFVKERAAHLQPSSLDELGVFIEQWLELPPGSELRNAIDACFLENVAAEEFTPLLAAHFGSRAREVLSYYGPAA